MKIFRMMQKVKFNRFCLKMKVKKSQSFNHNLTYGIQENELSLATSDGHSHSGKQQRSSNKNLP